MSLSSIIILIIIEGSCDEGFMGIDLLRTKSFQINVIPQLGGGLVNGNEDSIEREYALPLLFFNCSGTITGFHLAVDIQAPTQQRMMYPTIALLQNNTLSDSSSNYTLVSEEIEIKPDFNSSGLSIVYDLPEPLEFKEDQLLYVRQPGNNQSVVRLYYHDSKSQQARIAAIQPTMTNSLHYNEDTTDVRTQTRVLIRPIIITCEISHKYYNN